MLRTVEPLFGSWFPVKLGSQSLKRWEYHVVVFLLHRGLFNGAKLQAFWAQSTCRNSQIDFETAPPLAVPHCSFTFSFGKSVCTLKDHSEHGTLVPFMPKNYLEVNRKSQGRYLKIDTRHLDWMTTSSYHDANSYFLFQLSYAPKTHPCLVALSKYSPFTIPCSPWAI